MIPFSPPLRLQARAPTRNGTLGAVTRRNPERPESGRAHGVILGMATALLALAAYQGIVVAGVGSETGVAMPGEGPLVGDLRPPPATSMATKGVDTQVDVDIAWRSKLRPLPKAPACRLFVLDSEVPDQAVELLAGTGSLPMAASHPGDQQLARTRVNGRSTIRLVRMREDGVTLRLGAEILIDGQVVDANGHGVKAQLWVAGAEATTEHDGTFEVAAVGGEGLPLVAWADGLAAQTLVLDAWSNSSVRIVLQPGAQIRVRAIGTAGTEPASPQVYVLPAREPRTGAEAQYPFFLQAILGGVPLSSRGVALIGSLPLGARFRVRVLHEQVVAESAPSVEARLRGEVSVLLQTGGVMRGKVYRQDGSPIGGAWLAAWPEADGDDPVRAEGASCALPPFAYCRRGLVARSAVDGSFHIARSLRHGPSRLMAMGQSWAAELTVKGLAGELEHDVTLPYGDLPSGSGAASILLHAIEPGSYRVRIVERGTTPRPAASWSGTVPFPIPLRGAALADVKVTVSRADTQRVRALSALAIVEPVDITLPAAEGVRSDGSER